MRAVAKLEGKPGAIAEVEAEAPVAGPGEVLIRVAAGGICGTDVHIYDWPEYIAKEYAPTFPVIMGHEFAGTVVETGEGAGEFAPGQAVAVNPHLYCGTCAFCTSGRSVLCDDRPIIGCNRNGGWAELASVPAANVHPLPEGVEPEIGALTEPLTVAVHTVLERVPTRPGDTVLITGPGPVGLLTLLVARQAGARHVAVAGTASDRSRLQLAEELGAIPIDVERQDPAAAVRAIAPAGADVAYETSGSPAALSSAIAAVRKGGRVALVGFADDPSPVDTLHMIVTEKELLGVRAYDRNTWLKSVPLLSVLAPDLRKLISHTLPFSEIERAIQMIRNRECMKVLLKPEL